MPDERTRAREKGNSIMPDDTTPTIRELLLSITVGQAWALGSSIVALLVGSFILGNFIGSFVSAAKNAKLSDANEGLQVTINTLKDSLNTASERYQQLDAKTEFLNRYVSYLVAPNDSTSKQLFVDVVCSMWRDSERRRIRFALGPQPPFVVDRSPVAVVGKAPGRDYKLVKTVTFYDNTTYQMPQEISVAVHSDRECSILAHTQPEE